MKTKISLNKALRLAGKIKSALTPGCERIEIAGSIRRRCASVGDIELVAIPRMIPGVWQPSLFCDTQPQLISELDTVIDTLLTQKETFKRGDKNGALYKNFTIQIDNDGSSVGLDLFLTTAKQWGYIFALRTGPADFCHYMVTRQAHGGLCPNHLSFAGGWLVYNDRKRKLDTPDEADLFRILGLPYLEPEQRERWRQILEIPQ